MWGLVGNVGAEVAHGGLSLGDFHWEGSRESNFGQSHLWPLLSVRVTGVKKLAIQHA